MLSYEVYHCLKDFFLHSMLIVHAFLIELRSTQCGVSVIVIL